MKKLFSVVFLCLFLSISAFAQTFTFNELMKVRRVGDPQISPDGKTVAFTVGDVDKTANRVFTQIYTTSIEGGILKQLTKGDKSSSSPRWSPDGKKIAFTTGGQIWTMDADGDDKKQITRISTGAANPVWSPDGKWIAFNSEIYPECADDECNRKKEEAIENSKVKAIVTERLLYRHWVEWRDKKRAHVFVVSSTGSTSPADVTYGDYDFPPYGASTGVDYAFSPNSAEIAFLKNPDKVEAVSTNSDIFISPAPTYTRKSTKMLWDGGNVKNITAKNKGYDVAPVYTLDGKYIIYRSQATEAFEADRWRLMRYDRKKEETVELTRGFDLQVDEHIVSSDSKTVYFTAGERGRGKIFTVPVEPDFRLKKATPVNSNPFILAQTFSYISNLNLSSDGERIVFLASSMQNPGEIITINKSSVTNLSKANPPLNLPKAEDVDWTGALNAKVHGFLLKPANFDANKKYPLIVLIHGGPQGAWNDNWGFRWNPQIFANAGYVVFMPNPRGSTGYGQKFVNEVSADWGGRAFTDITNGIAHVLKKNTFIDKNRIGAAGASYGGYMVDWILGHNADPRFKFKALVSHAGIFNLESMASATEELWFVKWEFKGMPWENQANYAKWSPHKFAANFKTPTLVTAGELDYRVPVDQSLQLFTALQLNNTDSRLVVFPDEGHWILKPQNSEFWYKEVLGWFGKYLNP